MSKFLPRRRYIGILGLVIAFVTACGSTPGVSSATTTIHLAVVGPMTGDAAADGQHILQGAELARDGINGAGGIKSGRYKGAHIVIDTFDDTENVDRSVAIAHQIVDNPNEWAFIGTGFSDAAIATAPILDRAGVSYLSTYASSQQIIATPRKNVFVVPPTFPAYAFSAADRAYALGYHPCASGRSAKLAPDNACSQEQGQDVLELHAFPNAIDHVFSRRA